MVGASMKPELEFQVLNSVDDCDAIECVEMIATDLYVLPHSLPRVDGRETRMTISLTNKKLVVLGQRGIK